MMEVIGKDLVGKLIKVDSSYSPIDKKYGIILSLYIPSSDEDYECYSVHLFSDAHTRVVYLYEMIFL